MTYFFILGNNPTLSIAEIINVISGDIEKIREIASEFLILKTKQALKAEDLQKRFGGTIKIGQIVGKTGLDVRLDLAEKIIKILPSGFKKIYFGFSVYNAGESKNRTEGRVKTVALEIKKKLKRRGIFSRWVSSKQQILSSVIVKKNKLLNQGVEIVLLIGREGIFLGKTLSCQEFEEYSFYDFARPFRTIEKGMLPPKLAKIMINLSSCFNKKAVFLDPFCGSGTILQQAILMGYRNIIGFDDDKNAVLNTQKNLEWLLERSKINPPAGGQNTELQFKIQKCDVRNLSEKISPGLVDVIITEPYLGPLRFKVSDLKFIIEELSRLYISAFQEFKKVLNPNGRVVIIFPVFSARDSSAFGGKIRSKKYFLPILDQLKSLGWQTQPFVPDFLSKNKVTDRQSVIYSRPNQVILREIFVFKLSK